MTIRAVSARIAVLLLAALAPEAPAASRLPWPRYLKEPDAWYRGPEGSRAVANILSNQSPRGDWPKNFDTSAKPSEGDRAKITGTFDNGATVGELRVLARAYNVTHKDEFREAVLKGLDHILAAQYPSGGWPQYAPPPRTSYHRDITFNDGTMVNLMELLRDVAGSEEFAFVEPALRDAARKAFDAGIRCILKCQITAEGTLTVWCAQHDPETLEPRPARTFEPVSLSGGESAGLLSLLMSLDDPDDDVIRAVEAGARWYDAVTLTGIRVVKAGGDAKVVRDPDAPPLWARFYEIGTNRPLFCGRDGVIKDSLAEIERERRNGYAWYGNWGERVAREYARWTKDRAKAAARPSR